MEKDELLAYIVDELKDELERAEREQKNGSAKVRSDLFYRKLGLCTAISIIKSVVAGFEALYGLEEDFDAEYLH